MFTVCPKCALTLVVTAADLRVAQGYVRCGRCSNVFNALARLSEDRDAAAAAAQSQAPVHRAPDPQPTVSPVRAAEEPFAAAPIRQPSDPSPTSKARELDDPSAPTNTGHPLSSSSSTRLQQLADAPPDPIPVAPQPVPQPAPPAPPSAFIREAGGGDEDIPDDALEFNPAATDVTKVFVEQAPSPEFEAATGTFQAIRLEAEDAARSGEQRERAELKVPAVEELEPVDTQVDVEIDPELLATMAQLGMSASPPQFDPTAAPPRTQSDPTALAGSAHQALPTRAAAPAALRTPARAPAPPQAPGRPASAGPVRQPGATIPQRTPPPKTTSAAKPTPAMHPPLQPSPQPPLQNGSTTPIAARAKARVEAARPSFESARAIRALLVRKRKPSLDDGDESTAATFAAVQPGLWAAGSALMALLFAAQVVHHFRNDLAANPHFNRPLTSLYSALGIPLVPRWNLGAYEVRQLGASTGPDAPGQITVRASVKNDAGQSQPLPLLRVTLQDRFGNRIAARDVPPRSYLPGAVPGAAFLSAGQRVNAEMAFVDPGSNAVGFEIDACLPAPGGVIACANDSVSR